MNDNKKTAGTIMTAALPVTLFVAEPTTYYIFFTTIEIVCTALIVWYAWKWCKTEDESEQIA